eukprot:m.36300 g.36300  ORF g.36300 m.36300 type:complete len:116 (-) comp11254_c0_seq1:337-684(-)
MIVFTGILFCVHLFCFFPIVELFRAASLLGPQYDEDSRFYPQQDGITGNTLRHQEELPDASHQGLRQEPADFYIGKGLIAIDTQPRDDFGDAFHDTTSSTFTLADFVELERSADA